MGQGIAARSDRGQDHGLSDDRGRQPRAVHPPLRRRRRDDRVPAARERDGVGARPGDAGLGRRVGRARLGRRRPGDGRRVRSRAGAAGRSQLHLAPGLVDQGRGGRLLPRAGERGALAAVPRHVHPAGVPARALGDVPPGQRSYSATPSSRRPAIGRLSSSSRTTTSRSCRAISRNEIPT